MPPLRTRVMARLLAGKFDRMLAVGVAAPAGSALALHAARLTSADEREAIARTLRRTVNNARNREAPMSSRVPLNVPEHRRRRGSNRRSHPAAALAAAGDRARGRATALLLSDGAGPMYRYGRGDLEGRLGAALAAL